MIDILAQKYQYVNQSVSWTSQISSTEIFFHCERAPVLHQMLFGLVCRLLEN